jgi:hypothetical protein
MGAMNSTLRPLYPRETKAVALETRLGETPSRMDVSDSRNYLLHITNNAVHAASLPDGARVGKNGSIAPSIPDLSTTGT